MEKKLHPTKTEPFFHMVFLALDHFVWDKTPPNVSHEKKTQNPQPYLSIESWFIQYRDPKNPWVYEKNPLTNWAGFHGFHPKQSGFCSLLM